MFQQERVVVVVVVVCTEHFLRGPPVSCYFDVISHGSWLAAARLLIYWSPWNRGGTNEKLHGFRWAGKRSYDAKVEISMFMYYVSSKLKKKTITL